jgi:hypothetical protein
MYQTTLGTHHMRCKAVLPKHIKPFPMYLREAGYYCTNNSKTDYQFRHPKETWDASGRKGHWRNRKKGQPFFAVFNFTGCHESGIASLAKYNSVTADLKPSQRQDASKLTLPPYYPDTPIVREDWQPHRAVERRWLVRKRHHFFLERPRRRPAAREAVAVRFGHARSAHCSDAKVGERESRCK